MVDIDQREKNYVPPVLNALNFWMKNNVLNFDQLGFVGLTSLHRLGTTFVLMNNWRFYTYL